MYKDHLGKAYPSLRAMAEAYGKTYNIVYQRLYVWNWSLERALLAPVHKDPHPKNQRRRRVAERFAPASRFCSREYVRYLQSEQVKLSKQVSDASFEKCSAVYNEYCKLEEKINEVKANPFFYEAMDLYVMGDTGRLKLYDKRTVDHIHSMFDQGRVPKDIKEIYIDFNHDYCVV